MKNSGVVIVGSGPSLCQEDIELISNLPTISFNRSYRMFQPWNFSPTYYASFDPIFIEDCAQEIISEVLNKTESLLFINKKMSPVLPMHQRINLVTVNSNSSFEISTSEITDFESAGATSLQLAGGLGFKKIVLLGMDASYDLTNQSPQDINHFDPTYSDGIRRRKYTDLSNMRIGWEKAYDGCVSHGIQVINASRNTALTHIPRRPLAESLAWL